jgi:hypothetical protein
MEPGKVGQKVILPDFILPSRVDQQWQYSGIDSPESCSDKKHFKLYPHQVYYNYNSRGFRDQEWPTELTELQNAIWCIGDSFTVGLGSPVEHTWPRILQQQTGQRTINVSMDGASNEWMARKIKRIVEVITPKNIIVQWSYFHRGELPDQSQSDEDRRAWIGSHLQGTPKNISANLAIENFKNCVLQTKKVCKNCQLINSIIPNAFDGIDTEEVRGWWWNDRDLNWPSALPDSLDDISPDIIQQLKKKQHYNQYFLYYVVHNFLKTNNIIRVNQFDKSFNKEFARDGHHYDIVTATKFVNEVQTKFKLV